MLHIDRDGNQVYRTYNVFGNLTYEKAVDKNGENACVTICRYDSLGRLVQAVCDGHSYECMMCLEMSWRKKSRFTTGYGIRDSSMTV